MQTISTKKVVVCTFLKKILSESSVVPDVNTIFIDLLRCVIFSLTTDIRELATKKIVGKKSAQARLKDLKYWLNKVKKVNISVEASVLEQEDIARSWETVSLAEAFAKALLHLLENSNEGVTVSYHLLKEKIMPLLTLLVDLPDPKSIKGFIEFESIIVQAYQDNIPIQIVKKFWLDAITNVIFHQHLKKDESSELQQGQSKITYDVMNRQVLNRLACYLFKGGYDETITVVRTVLGIEVQQHNECESQKDVVLHVLVINLILSADKDGVSLRHNFSKDASLSLGKIMFAFVCEDLKFRQHVEKQTQNGVIKFLTSRNESSLLTLEADGSENDHEYIIYHKAATFVDAILREGKEAISVLTNQNKFDSVKDMQSVGCLRFTIGIFVGILGLHDEQLLQRVVRDIEGRWRNLFLADDDVASGTFEGTDMTKYRNGVDDSDIASARGNLRVSMLTFCICDLYQRHGLGTLQKNLKQYPWLLPTRFQSQDINTAFSDNFKLYGTPYQDALNSVSFFLAGECDESERKCDDRAFPNIYDLDKEVMVIISVLNMFVVVVEKLNRKHVDCVFEKLLQGRLLSHLIGSEANTITANSFYDMITSLRQQLHAAIPQDDMRVVIAQVLVHIWVMLAKSKVVSYLGIMTPFQDLGTCFGELYLPGMESDASAQVQRAAEGVTQWYSCQCGESYGVGNCGQLSGSGQCSKCGAKIGKGGFANQALLSGDKRGHILPGPDARSIREETSERSLSPQDRATLFAILHASLSLNAPNGSFLAEMLQHLRLDLTSLSLHSSMSIEDASLLVHAVVKKFIVGTESGVEHSEISNDKYAVWRTSEARRVWEDEIKTSKLDSIFLNSTSNLHRVRNDILDVGDDTTSKFRVLLQNSSKAIQNFEESFFSSGEQVVSRQALISHPLLWQTRERIAMSTLKAYVSKFTSEEQNQYQSITTILMGGERHKKREAGKGNVVVPEAFCLLKFLPDIVFLRDHVLGTLSYVAHEITTEHIKQKFPTIFKKLEETAKTLGIWRKSDMNPSPKKLFGQNGITDQVICCLIQTQNSIAIGPSSLQASAEMPRSNLISFDVFHDILPLAIHNARYSYQNSQLKVDFDFKNLEIEIKEKFLQGRPKLEYDRIGNDARSSLSITSTSGIGLSPAFIHVKNSIKWADEGRLEKVQKLLIESHERLQDYTESRDALAMILKFIEVRLNSSSFKTDKSQSLIKFITTGLRYKLPSCLEKVFSKEHKLVVYDCFWLFEMIKIRMAVILRQSCIQTFTTQNGFDEPLTQGLMRIEGKSIDSKNVLYWCAALHNLLTFWASTQHCYAEDHAMLDNISLKMRHPSANEPLFVYLAHFNFGDFYDESVSVGQGIAVFEALASQMKIAA
mmetsp:Transcript_36167/g.55255  ORF Transcript_36167/g.55255 Transcript_36167/m.55255 type:complete len:1370 (+) Transcript_36167:4297-8406(+)